MSSWFVHPRYLSAFAAAAERDANLRKGTHLRLFPSEVIGFPLAPWQLWNIDAEQLRVLSVDWYDRNRKKLPSPANLDDAEGEAMGWITAALPSDTRLIGVEVAFDDRDAGEIAVLAMDDRVVTARSTGRLLVGAPQVHRLRLRGRGTFTMSGWVVREPSVFERIVGTDPFGELSAPLDGDFPWYAGGRGKADAMKRVANGAPLKWTRPDRPIGPFDSLSEVAEEARVVVFQPEVDDEFRLLISDPDTVPSQVTRSRETAPGDPGPWQRVDEQIQGSLLLKSLDPGVGRYSGLLTLLRHLPDMEERPQPPTATAWLAAGLFACSADARLRIPPPDAQEQRLIERLVALEPSAQRVIDLLGRQRRFVVRALAGPALAAPVPDLPELPQLVLGEAAWLREKKGGPSIAFRQQICVTAPPLSPLIALARLEASGWTTRHEMLELAPGASPSPRAAPRFLGTTHTLAMGRFGVVEEPRVPTEGAPWTYQLALGDIYGRFGEAAELQVQVPPRPSIPAPTVRVELRLADRASHDQPAVAGSARVTIPTPALIDLAAGARPLARVHVALDGVGQSSAVSQAGQTASFDFQLPALMPMEQRQLLVRARFEDDAGTLGTEEVQAIDICDPRAPPIPKTGIGIVWTSRPAPNEEVEVRLRFTGTPNARYRVYASDARGLDIPSTSRTRAEIAVDGAQRGLSGLGMRDRFRLLTNEPLETAADGSVIFDARFPRALETVQFLRFVPLGARGSEAAFESCPLLPVAVPSDRAPPAPTVDVRTDAAGIARVKIAATGIDLVALAAAEPGLFVDPPDPLAKAPGFRLRRASGAVPQAIYAREIARGTLSRDGDGFIVEIADNNALIPFVRYHYWAEVRMPPERRVPAGTQEIASPAGAIQPLQIAQRQDAPGAYSLASAPAMTMYVPLNVATLEPQMVTATFGAAPGGWRIAVEIAGAPSAHARAVAQYRVEIHIEQAVGSLTYADAVEVSDGTTAWDLIVPGAVPASARVGLVFKDPIGRAAPPLFVEATPA